MLDAPVKKPQEDATKPPVAKKRTAGNKLFDWIVYPIIAFGAVFIVSVWVTYKGVYSNVDNWCKTGFDAMGNQLAKLPFMKSKYGPEERFRKARFGSMIITSFLTGTALTLPVQLFENARDKISAFFDRIMGTTPNDPSQYAKEPKSSWKSVVMSRVIGGGSTTAIGLIFGKRISDVSAVIANAVTGLKGNNRIIDWNGEGKTKASLPWKVAFVAVVELVLTAIAAIVLYTSNRVLSKMLNKKNDESLAKAVVLAVENKNPERVEYLDADEQHASTTKKKDNVRKSKDHKDSVGASRASPLWMGGLQP